MEDRKIFIERDQEAAKRNLRRAQEGDYGSIEDSSYVILFTREFNYRSDWAKENALEAKSTLEAIEAKFGHRPKILLVAYSANLAEELGGILEENSIDLKEDVEGSCVSLFGWSTFQMNY